MIPVCSDTVKEADDLLESIAERLSTAAKGSCRQLGERTLEV
jgi:hypothetical protein